MTISIIHDDPLIEQCGYCDNGIQGDQYCRVCNGDGLKVFDFSAVATLAHNIASGAGLCAAFYLGFEAGSGPRPLMWKPGCGVAVPPRQPSLYPCGCSKRKVNLGFCDQYQPGELP